MPRIINSAGRLYVPAELGLENRVDRLPQLISVLVPSSHVGKLSRPRSGSAQGQRDAVCNWCVQETGPGHRCPLAVSCPTGELCPYWGAPEHGWRSLPGLSPCCHAGESRGQWDAEGFGPQPCAAFSSLRQLTVPPFPEGNEIFLYWLLCCLQNVPLYLFFFF